MPYPPRLSAAVKLATVERYFELQNTRKVAAEFGITRQSVMRRLQALGINLRHDGGSAPAEAYNDMEYVARVKAELRELVELERERPVRRYINSGVPATVQLTTLELYMKYVSIIRVAKELGVTPPAVSSRLAALGVNVHGRGRRPPGAKFSDNNDMAQVEATIERLKAEIAAKEPEMVEARALRPQDTEIGRKG